MRLHGGRGRFRARHIVLLSGTAAAALACGADPAMAVDFRFVPRLEVSETYTDNVRLTEDNTQEDFVTTATFGGTLTAQSRKLNLSADYGGKYLIFAKSDEEDFRNSGRVAATFNAVEDYFSIRADGIID